VLSLYYTSTTQQITPMDMIHLDDIDTIPPFIPADWIGAGKKFTSDLPQHILAEKQRQLNIPECYSTHFPPPTVPVAQFIELKLPVQSTEIIMTSTTLWFSKEPARDNIRILLNRPIPPTEFLIDLDALDEHTKLLGLGEISVVDLDFDPLVKMCRRHQTRQATFGIRTRSNKLLDAAPSPDSETSIKMQIVRRMHEVLKEQDEHAIGTGYERAARWGKTEIAGNAANAAANAAAVARRVSDVCHLY
jgi:hypothetical protein